MEGAKCGIIELFLMMVDGGILQIAKDKLPLATRSLGRSCKRWKGINRLVSETCRIVCTESRRGVLAFKDEWIIHIY